MKCPQRYAYSDVLGIELIPGPALIRGTMGHLMQAHQHARWGAAQGGCWAGDTWVEDPDELLDPYQAIDEYCKLHPRAMSYLGDMVTTFDKYMEQYPEPLGRVLGVEYLVQAHVGTSQGEYVFWVEGSEKPADFEPCTVPYINRQGQLVGRPMSITRRIDLLTEKRGRTWIWDHKHQASVALGRSKDGYTMDGGFGVFRIMGQQLFGSSFGGVYLNLVQRLDPWKVVQVAVPPTPWRDKHLPWMIAEAEERLATLEPRDPWQWPKAQSETVCVGRYGACKALNLCRFGQRGLETMK